MLNAFAIQTEAEDALEDLFADGGPMKEIHEFMLIAGRGVDGEGGGTMPKVPPKLIPRRLLLSMRQDESFFRRRT